MRGTTGTLPPRYRAHPTADPEPTIDPRSRAGPASSADQRPVVDPTAAVDPEPTVPTVPAVASAPHLLGLRVHALVVAELDHVAVGIGERADVADRIGHVARRPRQAPIGLAAAGDIVDLLAAGHLEADVGERGHHRMGPRRLVAEEADQH